jgi:hypothetical protein
LAKRNIQFTKEPLQFVVNERSQSIANGKEYFSAQINSTDPLYHLIQTPKPW